MDHAEEQSMWRAIGACEQYCDDTHAEVERARAEIERVRSRDRLSFAFAVLAGFVLAAWAVGGAAEERVNEVESRAQFCMPGPYGVDPRPHGWKGGV